MNMRILDHIPADHFARLSARQLDDWARLYERCASHGDPRLRAHYAARALAYRDLATVRRAAPLPVDEPRPEGGCQHD